MAGVVEAETVGASIDEPLIRTPSTRPSASASSAGLAASVKVTLNPTDFEKLGLDAGTVVKVISGRGELMAPLAADFGVPAGSAMIPANAPGSNANTLIDASASVTDVRVERA